MSHRSKKVVIVPMPEPTWGERYCLGSGHIIAALQNDSRRRGQSVEICERTDLDYALHTPDHIASEILSHRPDIVGLGLYVWNQHVARRVAQILKREDPRIVVVGGGPWVSSGAKMFALANPNFDIVVSGPGEAAFAEVVARSFSGRGNARFYGVPGTVVRGGQDIVETPGVKVDPNDYPSPYTLGILDVRHSLRMAIRRGCGMRCRYCNWGGGFSVALSRERLAQDIAWATQQGSEDVWLVDSAVNRRPSDLARLAEAMALGDPEGRLGTCVFLDYKAVDADGLELLRRCRVRTAEVGLQTINPAAQRLAGRRLDLAQFERAVTALRGLADVTVDIILGLPGDDPEWFRRTVDYLADLDVRVHLFLLLALPGSDYSHNRDRYGLEFHDNGVPYLVRSMTFSPDDLRDCATWFVKRVRRKGFGSDFSPSNPRFARYPFNYAVPEEAYRQAHEEFGVPLPPPPCVPGQGEDRTAALRGMIEAVFGPDVTKRPLDLAGLPAIMRRCTEDRVQFDLVDPEGGRVEIFLLRRSHVGPAYRRVGPFDITYGRNPTLDTQRLYKSLDALAALIEEGASRSS